MGFKRNPPCNPMSRTLNPDWIANSTGTFRRHGDRGAGGGALLWILLFQTFTGILFIIYLLYVFVAPRVT